MSTKLYILSDATASGGLVIGLSNIYTILGIILTTLSIIVLLVNLFMRLHDRLKDGKLTNEEKADTAKEILELTNKIKELQEALEKEKNNGNNN